MDRHPTLTATVLILLLLAGAQLAVPNASMAAPSAGGGGWWNNSYQFRRSITVSNPSANVLVNQTVLVHLNFTENDVEDPLAGVRLVNSTGIEIPSAVVGARYSGPFLRSAFLIFQTDLQPRSSATYYVYYGSAFQNVPSYREWGQANILGSGFVTASVAAISRDSTQIQLQLGSVDSETLMTGVSYASAGRAQQYGPTTFSENPFTNDTGLVSGAQLNPQVAVASDVLGAGSIQLTRIVITSAKTALTIDALENTGTAALANVSLTSVVGLGGLTSLGSSLSTYTPSDAVLLTQNPDAYFGVQLSTFATRYALGTVNAITAEARTEALSGVNSYPLASAAAFEWSMGTIQASASSWVSFGWGVSLTPAMVGSSLPLTPIGGTLGGEEVRGIATPEAMSIWTTRVTITNLPIPAEGVSLPFGVGGASLVEAASTVTGSYSYSVPPSPEQDSQAWTSSTSSTANGTGFASTQYYAFDINKNVERVAGTIPNTNSTATGSVTSSSGFAFRGSNAVLRVTYKATSTTSSGILSAQDLFVAADLDPTLTGNFSQSIVLPVSGTSNTIPISGCETTGKPTPALENVVPAGLLLGDNSWRTVSVNLPPTLPAAGFNVKLRVCLATSPGFAGSLDLEVASAGVVLSGPTSAVLRPTLSYSTPELNLGYLPQASLLATGGTTANLTISFVADKNASVAWQSGTSFSGFFSEPTTFTLNGTSLKQEATIGDPQFVGIAVGSSVSNAAQSALVDGSKADVAPGTGLALITATLGTAIVGGGPFVVGLKGEAYQVSVLDQDQAGVPGVKVFPIIDGKTLPMSSVTGNTGVAQLQIVPWTFQLNATYQDRNVGFVVDQSGAQPSTTISAELYNLTLAVKDSHGGALPGAEVFLYLGKYNFSGTTDTLGRYNFEGVANSDYNVTVSVGGGIYFSSLVGTSSNNALIELTTTYLPPSTQLLAIGLIALVPVIVIAAYLVARRLTKRK